MVSIIFNFPPFFFFFACAEEWAGSGETFVRINKVGVVRFCKIETDVSLKTSLYIIPDAYLGRITSVSHEKCNADLWRVLFFL